MSKAGKQIIKALEEVKEFVVHPGEQAIYIEGDSVIISAEHYENLKAAVVRDHISKLDDRQLLKLADMQIKAACKVIKSRLPRYIEARSAAGVTFREGYEDVISEAIIAAKQVDISDLCGND